MSPKPRALYRTSGNPNPPGRRARYAALLPLPPGEGRGEGQPAIQTPHIEPHNTSAWAQYTVQLPVGDAVAQRVASLSMHPGLQAADQQRNVATLVAACA